MYMKSSLFAGTIYSRHPAGVTPGRGEECLSGDVEWYENLPLADIDLEEFVPDTAEGYEWYGPEIAFGLALVEGTDTKG